MNEVSIWQSILQQVETVRLAHGASRVLRIQIRVGPLSGVVPGLLAAAFPAAAAGTPSQHADLDIRPGAVRIRCQRCGAETEVSMHTLICPKCGAWWTRLVAGAELLVETVELDNQPEPCPA